MPNEIGGCTTYLYTRTIIYRYRRQHRRRRGQKKKKNKYQFRYKFYRRLHSDPAGYAVNSYVSIVTLLGANRS